MEAFCYLSAASAIGAAGLAVGIVLYLFTKKLLQLIYKEW